MMNPSRRNGKKKAAKFSTVYLPWVIEFIRYLSQSVDTYLYSALKILKILILEASLVDTKNIFYPLLLIEFITAFSWGLLSLVEKDKKCSSVFDWKEIKAIPLAHKSRIRLFKSSILNFFPLKIWLSQFPYCSLQMRRGTGLSVRCITLCRRSSILCYVGLTLRSSGVWT